MAIPRISVIATNYQQNIRKFSVQSVDDLALLPRYGICGSGDTVIPIRSTNVGSRAFVRDTGATYELNAENKWQKISVASSGSSSGGSTGGDTGDDDLEYADKEDIDSLFPDTPTNPDTDSSVDDETLVLPDSNGTVEDETWVVG